MGPQLQPQGGWFPHASSCDIHGGDTGPRCPACVVVRHPRARHRPDVLASRTTTHGRRAVRSRHGDGAAPRRPTGTVAGHATDLDDPPGRTDGKLAVPSPVDHTVRIDIWSDVICPWCYLGSRRLDAALDRMDADGTLARGDVDLHWRAFELDPRASAAPTDLRAALERKYGPGSFDAMTARLTALGAPEGIDYRFDLARRVNTFDAHRLIAWAAGQESGQGPLVERLFRAYFTEGADISDAITLTRLAGEAGLDPVAAGEVLADGTGADEVRADETEARETGLTGVPAFVVDGRPAIPGAQEVDHIVRVLTRMLDRR